MKRCSTSLAWRDIQIGQDEKAPPIHSDEGQLQRPMMGERNQNPGHCWGGVDSDASTCGKHPGTSSKLYTGSPPAPAVQFLGIYSKKLKTGVQKKKKKTPYTRSQQRYSQHPKGGGTRVHRQRVTQWGPPTRGRPRSRERSQIPRRATESPWKRPGL